MVVLRLEPAGLGFDPDLQQVQLVVPRGVKLAVGHACAGAHHLYHAVLELALLTHRVLVVQLARQHVRDDLHVVVRVGWEAATTGDTVFVEDTQRAEAHVARIKVATK